MQRVTRGTNTEFLLPWSYITARRTNDKHRCERSVIRHHAMTSAMEKGKGQVAGKGNSGREGYFMSDDQVDRESSCQQASI